MLKQIEATQNKEITSAYSEAIKMISYEGQLIWTVFRAILAANSFLVAVFVAISSLLPEAKIGLKALPVIGFMLCVIWCLISLRMFDYYSYWFAWARHCEESIFPEEFRVLTMGRKFSDGNEVTLGKEMVRMGWYGRLFKNKHMMLTVIILFIFIYVYLGYLAFYHQS